VVSTDGTDGTDGKETGSAGSQRPAGTITTVRRYELPLVREAVWSLITEVGNHRRWWSWLRACDTTALAVGEEWGCEVQPPVPYAVRFRVSIKHVAKPTLVRARVSGDVVGDAVLTLEEQERSTVAVLRSALAPGNTALQLVSRFAAPVARFGHDWVLDSGARQFVARAVVPAVGGESALA
jgi:uncharacterized protein YndB with AHSA1/START domain